MAVGSKCVRDGYTYVYSPLKAEEYSKIHYQNTDILTAERERERENRRIMKIMKNRGKPIVHGLTSFVVLCSVQTQWLFIQYELNNQ